MDNRDIISKDINYRYNTAFNCIYMVLFLDELKCFATQISVSPFTHMAVAQEVKWVVNFSEGRWFDL